MAANEDEASGQDEYFVLWTLIAQTKDAILKARERDYSRYGITNERRAILYTIQKNGGHTTPVEIARHLFREIHTVTEMLKRMEASGLLERYEGSGRSKVEVRLTDRGLDVFNQSRHNETDRRIFSVLAKDERAPRVVPLEAPDQGSRRSRHPRVATRCRSV